MQDIKHVGKITKTGRKCLVAFRTLPGESFSCLIVPTENLPESYHDALISLVEGNAAQTANEFGEVLARATFPDGSRMLAALHTQGKLVKVSTSEIMMTPNFQGSINLAELNQIIAEQKGVAVDDLALKDNAEKKDNIEVVDVATIRDISPELAKSNSNNDYARTTSQSVNEEPQAVTKFDSVADEAKYYRSQADVMAKQAAAMRRKAEELVPTKKAK
jgi:hypothetical protein